MSGLTFLRIHDVRQILLLVFRQLLRFLLLFSLFGLQELDVYILSLLGTEMS